MNTRKTSLAVKITPVRKRMIAEVENHGLYEVTFSLSGITQGNSQTSHDDYVSVRQASDETGMSERHLRRLAKEGKIEAAKVNNKWFLLRDAIETLGKRKG